jgi:DNA-binding MarR family transcriptional regulator
MLIESGWVKAARRDDRRERYLQLTPAGRRKFQEATPAWRRAHHRLKKAIGRNWEAFDSDLRRITGAV